MAPRGWPSGARAILLILSLAPAAGQGAQMPVLYERATPKVLAEVLDDLDFAITERNFRITGRLSIGKAIRERDGGSFPDYEVILFCNLGLAKNMLELEPEYVVFCPGKVAVRDTSAGIIISAPLLPEDTDRPALNALSARINGLIRQIVDYGAQPWSPGRQHLRRAAPRASSPDAGQGAPANSDTHPGVAYGD